MPKPWHRLCGLVLGGRFGGFLRRFFLEYLGVVLVLVSCAEPKAEHRELRGHSQAAASADARVSPEALASELRDIVGFDCPEAPTSLAYGEQQVVVRAKSYWTSTGLYLRPGETARLTSVGEWTVWAGKTPPFGADGNKSLTTVDDCPKGALVAKVGLSLDSKKICIGADGTALAGSEGILYLAMNDSASPAFHDGEITVTVASAAATAPQVEAADAETFDFCSLASGWTEVESPDGLLLTLPAALAASAQTEMPESLVMLDEIYARASELLGGTLPFAGEALRFYPDFAVRKRGWIVAGNPLLYDPKNLNARTPSAMKILDLAAQGSKLFDFTRAIGVNVARAHGARYQLDDASAEAWGGLIATYVSAELPLGPWPREACLDQEKQAASGTFATFAKDPWLELCLLTELQKAYGWRLFTQFFANLPADWNTVLPASPSPLQSWQWVYLALSEAAGEDLSATFSRFKIPLP